MMVNSATVADRQGQDTNCKVRLLCDHIPTSQGFPCGSAVKESACNVGDLGLIPGLGRSPGEGNGYSLQYSDLENSMDCIVHGILQARILQSVAVPRGSSQPRDQSQVSHIAGGFFTS